jgi:hypothetical protein
MRHKASSAVEALQKIQIGGGSLLTPPVLFQYCIKFFNFFLDKPFYPGYN